MKMILLQTTVTVKFFRSGKTDQENGVEMQNMVFVSDMNQQSHNNIEEQV